MIIIDMAASQLKHAAQGVARILIQNSDGYVAMVHAEPH